jgi:hypothetical protein
MSSFETLILKRVLILSGSHDVPEYDEDKGKFQKGTFLIYVPDSPSHPVGAT